MKEKGVFSFGYSCVLQYNVYHNTEVMIQYIEMLEENQYIAKMSFLKKDIYLERTVILTNYKYC